jgi:hypothetical protein
MTGPPHPRSFGRVTETDRHHRHLFEENHHMYSAQTLHDFVLNLLTDPDARSAFDLDPEGALNAAGLTDVTAADVQDVVPLVVDSVPVPDATPLAALGQPLNVDGLDSTDAVSQLQIVTQQMALTPPSASVDVNAGILGTLAVDPGYVGATSIVPGLGFGVSPGDLSTDLGAVHDVAGTLDVATTGYAAGDVLGTGAVTDPAVANVSGNVDGLLSGATHGGLPDSAFAVGAVSNTVHTATGLFGSVTGGDLGGGDLGGLGLDGGSVLDPASGVGGVTDHANDALGGLTGTVHGATGGLTDSLHGSTGGLTGSLHGSTGGATGIGAGGTEAHADADAQATASADHGVLGLTDGLF